MPSQLAPPSVHRSDSQRSDGSRRVTFRRGVDVRGPGTLRRQPPPASAEEVAQQAEEIIRQLDSVTCDVRTTERPINNGLRPPGQQADVKFGSLGRASIRKQKKSKPSSKAGSVKSVSTNTLPAPATRDSSIEADKNNILKAESLKRERARKGEFSRLQVNGFLKRSSSQVDHLNNLNSLKDEDDRYTYYPNKLRPSSEDRDIRDDDVDFEKKRLNSKLSSRPSHRSTPTLPTIRITPEYEAPLKVPSSTSRSGDETSRPSQSRPSVSRLEPDTMPRQAPPPRPDRAPGQFRPLHGFSYIGHEDAERIGHADSVETRSRRIIDSIARSRSRSPDTKPGRTKPRSRSSSPDPVPGMRPFNYESPRGRYDYESPEEPKSYEFDPPRLTRTYNYEPPKLARPYEFDSPSVGRNFRETSPLLPSSFDADPFEPAIRVIRPDAPPVTHTFRYEYDSSGEPRTYRDDVPETRTRTYHFQSEPPEPTRATRQAETTRSYRFQENVLDSSFDQQESRRDRFGSSIVMIGEHPPEIVTTTGRRPDRPSDRPNERSTERSPRLSTVKEGSIPSDEEQHYRAPRGGDLYSIPRQSSPRDTENIIRLSVSGSHSSGAEPDSRRVDRQVSAGFEMSPERPRLSPSDTTERRREERRDERRDQRTETTKTRRIDVRRADASTRHVSSSSESPRRRDSRDPSEERRPPRALNGHRREVRETRETREKREKRDSRDRDSRDRDSRDRDSRDRDSRDRDSRDRDSRDRGHGTIERVRKRVDRERHHESKHKHDRKKNFEIKFMYDEREEPSDVRLAKFTEYRGSDEATSSPSPEPSRRRRSERGDESDVGSWRPPHKDGPETFITRVESSRTQTSERRDGREQSPRPRAGDRDPHGEWSSRTDEDRVDGGTHRRTEKTTKTTRRSEGTLREDRGKQRSSVSSDETKRQRSRARSASPDRRSRDDRTPDKSADKPKKKGWLSATLSRLDLRKSADEKRRSNSPKRRGSHSPDRPLESNRTEASRVESGRVESSRTERRERRTSSSNHGTVSRRRDGRSGSRDSYGTSDERGQMSSDRERPARGSRDRRAGSHEPRRHAPVEQRDSARSSDRETTRTGGTTDRRGGRTSTSRREERTSSGRPVSRSASFQRRYQAGEDEVDSPRGGGRPASRRPSNAGTGTRRGRRGSQSVTSSLNSSGSDPAGPAASRATTSGDRSVYLHATTVADIPSPDNNAGAADPAADSEPLPTRERRKVSRSFSMLTPFRLKHPNDKTINYENDRSKDSRDARDARDSRDRRDGGGGGGDTRANGRPPRAPRPRRDSRDELADSSERSPDRHDRDRDRERDRDSRERRDKHRHPVSRSSSLPKGSRSGYRSEDRPAR